jgi:hypothetical protein
MVTVEVGTLTLMLKHQCPEGTTYGSFQETCHTPFEVIPDVPRKVPSLLVHALFQAITAGMRKAKASMVMSRTGGRTRFAVSFIMFIDTPLFASYIKVLAEITKTRR